MRTFNTVKREFDELRTIAIDLCESLERKLETEVCAVGINGDYDPYCDCEHCQDQTAVNEFREFDKQTHVQVGANVGMDEAIDILGLTERTIETHISRNLIDVVYVGKQPMFSSAQLKMYAKARETKETRLDWCRSRKQR